MSQLPQFTTEFASRTIRQPDRSFATVNDICIAFSSFVYATSHIAKEPYTGEEGMGAFVKSAIFPTVLVVPTRGPLEVAVRNELPGAIELCFLPPQPPPPPAPPGMTRHQTTGITSALLGSITAQFMTFYERHVEWIRANVNSDVRNWPEIFKFARVIRNAIAHYGHISIGDPKAPTATWHGKTFGPSDNGRKIFTGEISIGDLIVLLVEFSDELDARGAPFP